MPETGARIQRTGVYLDKDVIIPALDLLRVHDARTADHSIRVLIYCAEFAVRLGMTDREYMTVKTAAVLHDVGKVLIPVPALERRGPLSPDEWHRLRSHPKMGSLLLGGGGELQEIGEVICAHHERWDGSGYPNGLRGEEIPYCSRVLSVADSLDAMTSGRGYQPNRRWEEAIAEIQRCAGTFYDPNIVSRIFAEPLEPVKWPPVQPDRPAVPDGPQTGAGLRVLMIDDDPSFLSASAAVLERAGFAVATAGDGQTALDSANQDPPDVVVTDMDMPGMTGLDVLSSIKRYRPGLPVIGISGAPWAHGYLRLAQAERCDMVMMKPIGAEEMVEAIREVVARR